MIDAALQTSDRAYDVAGSGGLKFSPLGMREGGICSGGGEWGRNPTPLFARPPGRAAGVSLAAAACNAPTTHAVLRSIEHARVARVADVY